MTRRERDDQVAMVGRANVRQDHEAAIPIARKGLNGALDFANVADWRLDRLDVKRLRRNLNWLPEHPGEWRRVRIEDEHHTFYPRRHMLERLQPLAADGEFETGEIAAGTREARHEAAANRIGHLHEHYRQPNRRPQSR